MLTKLTGMPYSKSDGYGAVMYNLLLSRQQQAINNAETVLAEISHGNPAEEESSTTVQRLVVELNKYRKSEFHFYYDYNVCLNLSTGFSD